jgi:hypothetical protein
MAVLVHHGLMVWLAVHEAIRRSLLIIWIPFI